MSRLKWDKTAERFYEFGVDHGVLYLQDTDGTYPKGEVWNGLTEVNETPGGAQPNDIYADDIKYASLRSAETWGATIGAYFYPESFNECNGATEVKPGIYAGQQNRNGFGFSYRTKIGNDTATSADDGFKIHLCYGCTASPSDSSHVTINDSPTPTSMSWDVTSIPIAPEENVTLKPLSTIVINSLKVKKEEMDTLMDILYGTDAAEARLPLPDEVFSLFSEVATPEPPDENEGTY